MREKKLKVIFFFIESITSKNHHYNEAIQKHKVYNIFIDVRKKKVLYGMHKYKINNKLFSNKKSQIIENTN